MVDDTSVKENKHDELMEEFRMDLSSITRPIYDLTELCHIAYETAVAKGWHDEPRSVPEVLMLIVTEAAEGMEDFREGHDPSEVRVHPHTGKPLGLPTELADIVIRVMDTAVELGIDLTTVIRQKMHYNTQRAYRHGGKLS